MAWKGVPGQLYCLERAQGLRRLILFYHSVRIGNWTALAVYSALTRASGQQLTVDQSLRA
jgi:hypothetical protein